MTTISKIWERAISHMGKGKSCSHDDKFCVVFTHRVSLVGSGIELCQFLSMFSMFTCNEIGPETDLHFFFVYSREKATVVKMDG